MRYAAGAFNDKTPSLRAGGFTMRSHVIESSLYRHSAHRGRAPSGDRTVPRKMTLRHIGFVA
jgi:hypothetical protein